MIGRLLLLGVLAGRCGNGSAISAVDRGAALASSPALSSSPFNDFSCTTCHAVSAGDPRILPGWPLAGATARPTYWGGAYRDLKEAVDFCLVYFMKGDVLDREDPDARALYEYLVSLEDRGPQEALPLTVVLSALKEPERGDPQRGAEVHLRACSVCHGEVTSGDDHGLNDAVGLPTEAKREAKELLEELGVDYPVSSVFIEKVRHGRFYGVGGTMPPFTLEALSDEDLGALLAFYGL